MAKSVFTRTVGLRGEDTSTEVLAYLLSADNPSVPFQKLFFLRVFGGVPKGSTDLNVEVVTRPVLAGGTPDALVLTEDALILLENKLGSPLSGDDQLVRYVPILRDHDLTTVFPTLERARIKKRIFVFLAPRATIVPSLQETNRRCLKHSGQEFEQVCNDSGIQFVSIAWEDVIDDLDVSNTLQLELRTYVQDYTQKDLTMHEMEILKDASVPAALEKLFARLITTRDSLSAVGFSPQRMGQSYNLFGFMVKHEHISLWFGYSGSTWMTDGAPVVLQLREGWIKTAKEPILEAARGMGFFKNASFEWILPFPIVDIEKWDSTLRDTLEQIAIAATPPPDLVAGG